MAPCLAGDLPQRHRLALARSLADTQLDGRVGQVALMRPAPVVGAGDGRELLGGQVGSRAFAPGQQVEPGRGDVGEQRRGPAAPVKAHRHPPPLARDLPQPGQQPAHLAGQRVRRLADHHEHRIAVLIGDPGLHRRGSGELRPGHVRLLHGPRPVLDAGVPVDIQEPQRIGPARGVQAGQRHHQLGRLARGGQLARLTADRLDFRPPVQAQHPAQAPPTAPGWRPRPAAPRSAPGTPASGASRPARRTRP